MFDLKKKSDLHLERKIWHMGSVALMALFYSWAPEAVSLLCLIVGALVIVPMDYLRLKNPALNEVLVRWFRVIIRKSEVDRLSGSSYLVVGVLIVVAFFPKDVVLLTLLFLAFADPVASYFGIRFGKDKIFGHKSLQGTLAAFVVCTLVTFLFLSNKGILPERIIAVSLIGGLVGALAELIPIGKLDDNFTLPVLSGTALWMIFGLFGAAL
jgi:dolichol kinase